MAAQMQPIHARDSLEFTLDVTIDETSPAQTLAGAAIDLRVQRDGRVVGGTAELIEAPNVLQCRVPKAALAAGEWLVQVHVDTGDSARTVFEGLLTVARSNPPAPA
ncbi:MAG TPA: hypothetical protein PKD10_08705 [Paracoccaceae bacterium]|nr:hypothetical protein [Paracoccaceae bacterium]